MSVAEILQLVVQGGSLVLLALVLLGLYKIGKPAVEKGVIFLSGLVAEQTASREALVGLVAEQRAGFQAIGARIDALENRFQLTEERVGAVVDRSAQDVIGVVRERSSNVGDRIAGELARGPGSAAAPATSCADRERPERTAVSPRCAA